jgi:hypothetical protein
MSLESFQRTRLATVGILCLVLGAGFLIGMAWDRRLAAQITPPASTQADASADDDDDDDRRRMAFYRVEPPLSEAQLAEAEAITARRRQAARDLFEEPLIDSLYDAMKDAEDEFEDAYDPRFRALVDSSRAVIRQLMTPEQATNYDSILAEGDRRRRDGGG